MTYTIVYEKIAEPGFEGYYYAHIPTLDLTTHGLGVQGAKEAATDLLKLWVEERQANGEDIKEETDVLVSKLVI